MARRPSRKRGNWAFIAVLLCVALGSAMFLIVRYVDWPESVVPVPASEILAERFPDGWRGPPARLTDTQALLLRAFAAPMGSPEGARPSGISFAPMQVSETQFLAALATVDARTGRRPPRPNAVFNDAQIVSIKERLALTAEQEEHWPPMEAALRDMSWERKSGASAPVLNAESLQRLHEVATVFVTRLNERQKQQVKTLANVVGLPINFNGR